MRRALVGLVGLLLMVTGCGGPAASVPEETPPSPFQSCPAEHARTGASTVTGGELVPDLVLPCFVGGEPVSLRTLGQPAVLNLWASSCGPCRDEMPALQHFADDLAGRVLVLGVVTGDTRSAAAWAGADFGVHYPSLFDPDSKLLKALGRNAIPVSVFVDAQGVVRYVDVSGSLTETEFKQLATDHLGLST